MATTTSGYLEQYLDSLENLPSELKKNFNRMHDLDTKNKDILVEIDTSSDDYLRKVRDLSPTKRKAEMEKIQVRTHFYRMLSECDCFIVLGSEIYWFSLLNCVPLENVQVNLQEKCSLSNIQFPKLNLERCQKASVKVNISW